MAKTQTADEDRVLLAWQESIAILTLNYPRRKNAFGLKMRERLYDRLYDLCYHNRGCGGIVLTGAGNDFCAGGDISEMADRSVLEYRERSLLPLKVFKLLTAGPKPVVAAVEGVAMGAGVALAAAADYVVTARNARYASSFLKVGLLPDTGLYWSLAKRVGGGKARELMMTAREFSGDEAYQSGYANALCEPGESLSVALEAAKEFASKPPLTLAHLKAALSSGSDTLDVAIETEVNLQPLVRRSEDHKEAVSAFMEKRNPVFVGN